MAQNIEFYLNPPSPIQKPDNIKWNLPPVSSLLLSSEKQTDFPRLCLQIPSPSLSSCSASSIRDPYSYSSNTASPSLSPFMSALSFVDSLPSPQASPGPAFLLPPPTNTRRCRSLSNASNDSITITANQRRLSDPPLYTKEQDVSTIKRKRGRPPNSTIRKPTQHDSWTFVTPTICDIKQQKAPVIEKEEEEDEEDDFTVLHWPSSNKNQPCMTSTTPKKKRGRKPKVQLAGNFCFVWRDLTARRGANKKKKP